MTGTPLTAALTPLTPFSKAMGEAFASLAEFARRFKAMIENAARNMVRHVRQIRERANAPHVVAGLESRYYVRAAFDPSYADPATLVGRVQADLRGSLFLTEESRQQIIRSAVRGYYAHRVVARG